MTTALYIDLCADTSGQVIFELSKSTDMGVTWANITPTTLQEPGYDVDRPYLWTDHISHGSYGGRTYLTFTRIRPVLNNTEYSVGLKYSDDDGATWSPFKLLASATDYEAYVQLSSLAIQPSGNIVAIWDLTIIASPRNINTINWARSTDGGATFPKNGSVYVGSGARSIPFNDQSPGSFFWSIDPNIAADPVAGSTDPTGNGSLLYAVWAAYRIDNDKNSAGIYLSKGTANDQGNIVWATPTVVYNGDNSKYQYFPWVQVSRDQVVHITFGAQPQNEPNVRTVNAYYVQSTDEGKTFTQPFQLHTPFTTSGFMGDYQATSIGGYRAELNGVKSETIFSAWTRSEDGTGHTEDRWGRYGTFCSSVFTDEPPGSTFYPYSRCLACKAILGGYPCGNPEPCDNDNNPYFRPSNNVTRGQVAKIVSNAVGITADPGPQIYQDVAPDNEFYTYVNRVSNRGYMSGYPCGTVPNEPCGPDMKPYFRPYANSTRAQISKVVSIAAGFTDTPTGQTYTDVLTSNEFYIWIERLTIHGVVTGYPCGGPGEPCDSKNRPYFRLYSLVTRGQTAKIVSIAFFPTCVPPSPDNPSSLPGATSPMQTMTVPAPPTPATPGIPTPVQTIPILPTPVQTGPVPSSTVPGTSIPAPTTITTVSPSP